MGIASRSRSPDLPDLPTLAEQLNAPHYDVTTIFAVMAPAGTPQAVIDRLNSHIVGALTSTEIQKRYTAIGATPVPPMSPSETSLVMKQEADRLGSVIRAVRAQQK
jgi:tripartite-type tricarboxylate transporter receptor subunit TctC